MKPDEETEVLETPETDTNALLDASEAAEAAEPEAPAPIKLDIDDVEDADLPTLLAFYNTYAKRKKKTFADRPTAQKAVRELIRKMVDAPPPAPPTAEELEAKATATAQKRSDGTKRSWENPEIREKRIKRFGVEVDGVYFASFNKAYEALGLPLSKLIGHRIDVKEKTVEDPNYVDEEYGHTWKVVPYQHVEKAKKVPAEGSDVEGEAEA